MAEIELIIKANTDPYVKGIKDAQKATQDLHNTVERGTKREKGLIEDIENEMKKLQELKRKAWTVEDIEKYNRKLQEAKFNLDEYDKAGLKAQKTTDSLMASFTKWILSVAGATVILKKLKDAFLETTAGINLFNQASAVTRTVLNDIVTTGRISIATIRQSIETQRILNDLRLEEIKNKIEIAQLGIEYQENYVKALDQTLSKEEKLKAIDTALAAHNKRINIQVHDAQVAAEALRNQIEKTVVPSEKIVTQYANLIAEIKNLEAERDASTKRLQSRRSGILQEEIEKELKWKQDLHNGLLKLLNEYNADQLRKQEQYQNLSQKLLNDYEKSQIDVFEGKEKLEAQRDFGIKQIKQIRDQLKTLGPLTQEQIAMLQVMADNVWKEYYKALVKEAGRPTPEQQEAITKALLGDMEQLPGLITKDIEKIQKEIDDTIAANAAMESFSIWKLIGIDPESDEGAKQKEALENMASTVIDTMDEIYDRRVDDAQRTRELLDTQIAETQRAIEFEMDMAEEGYANNVTAQKQQLDKLKAQREQALKDEEAAIKKQRALETVMQTAALITASAQTFKAFPGPLLPLAIATVAAMFAAFIASKSKAKQSVTELAEGGSGSDTGFITGKSHNAGGEGFLDHVEVERGESWGVLSRGATDKYGKVFHEMVSSFNKDEMPGFIAPPISNSVKVENSGPNSRLDKVNTSIKKLSDTIIRQPQINISGGKRIIKSGNKIRIVG